MKTKLLMLALVLFSTHVAFSSLDSNKLLNRWKVTQHTKKSHAMPSQADDFMQFDAMHSFEQVKNGIYTRGGWRLNPSTSMLTISSSEGVFEWKITELNDHALKLSRGQEILEMEAVKLKICIGDPYDDLTIICGKWKVADHKAHYSRVQYKVGDYIRFFPDGTVEEVRMGVYKKMTWEYDAVNSKLIISNQAWEIQDLEQKQLNAGRSAKNEQIVLIKL